MFLDMAQAQAARRRRGTKAEREATAKFMGAANRFEREYMARLRKVS